MLKCAQIYVFNYGPIGLEALKNLMFGGIGSFTIVYASKVCASDLGNNYFGMLLFLLYVSSLA
jgi:amyloid beta precursor protein binding protein 1